MREPTLADTEAWLHGRIEASTDPYLPRKLPEQNQHHSKQGYKCNHNTGVHSTGRLQNVITIRVYIPQEGYKCNHNTGVDSIGIKCNHNTGVHTTGINSKKES